MKYATFVTHVCVFRCHMAQKIALISKCSCTFRLVTFIRYDYSCDLQTHLLCYISYHIHCILQQYLCSLVWNCKCIFKPLFDLNVFGTNFTYQLHLSMTKLQMIFQLIFLCKILLAQLTCIFLIMPSLMFIKTLFGVGLKVTPFMLAVFERRFRLKKGYLDISWFCLSCEQMVAENHFL